jgi:hypothetical protein
VVDDARGSPLLWCWLTVATTLSVGGNVGHAWLTVVAAATRGMAIGWAVAPPALLMLAIHGLPTLGRMLGSEERDRLLAFVVWGVTVGAFGWSAFGIFGFTTAMGVPAAMAWVAPFVIDLSVFGATRGLVLTAPQAARMKAAVAGAAAAADPTDSATLGAQSAVPSIATSTVTTDSMPEDESVRADSRSPAPDLVVDACEPEVPTESAPAVALGTRELAEQIVAAGAVRKPVETVVAILSAAEQEPRKAVIAEHTGVHHSVVTKTLEAAESYRRKPLAAVG